MLGGIKLEESRLIMSEAADKAFDQLTENMRRRNQCSASLEQNAWQPRLAMKADVTTDTNICKGTKGTAAAVQTKHEDRYSAKMV